MYQDPATIQPDKEPFEYTVICREPKRYRVDTSSFLHQASLLKEYGYWKPLPQVGRAHDWDMICRWLGQDYHGKQIKDFSEPWMATEQATLVYRVIPAKMNARGIYDYYKDQLELPTDMSDPNSRGNFPRLLTLARSEVNSTEVPEVSNASEVSESTDVSEVASAFESDPENISSDDEPQELPESQDRESQTEALSEQSLKVPTSQVTSSGKTPSIGTQGQITELTPELIEQLKLPTKSTKSTKKIEQLLRPRGTQENNTQTKSEQHSFCLTTLHCQDREPIFSLIGSVIKNTSNPIQGLANQATPLGTQATTQGTQAIHATQVTTVIPWIILAQGCTEAHIEKLQDFLANLDIDWLEFQIKIVEDNLGCSKGHDLLAELAKDYYYVMILEDDWVCQPESRTQAPKSWLKTCLTFLETNPQVSTLFLRHYLTEDEKSKSGWGRHIPYRCHKRPGNFNYRTKLLPDTIQNINGIKFQAIPNFLFTFNPCIRRNPDYYRVRVYPLDICDDRSAEMGGWKSSDHKNVSNWGWSEAWAMEKTYDLITYNVARGLFSHYEHLELFENRARQELR